MLLRHVLPFAVALTMMPLQQAVAQFPGMPGGGAGFGPPAPAAPPPACQQLLTTRDEMQKHGNALAAASKRKAPPPEACKLFKNFIAVETKMMKGIEEHGTFCGVPPQIGQEMKAAHVQYTQVAKQVCDVAANMAAQKPAAPSLSDALGTPVPDASNIKGGRGTFDTLTGSSLGR